MIDNDTDRELDRLLSDAGQEWRATLPASPDPYPALDRRVSGHRTVNPRRVFASLAGVVAIVVVTVLVAVSLPSTNQAIASATQTTSTTTRPSAIAQTPPPSAILGPWRLILKIHLSGADTAYMVRAATTDEQWQQLWRAANPSDPPPHVDLSREIVVSFAHGVGSSCPDLRLDDLVIDVNAGIIYSVVSNPLGDIPCTADLAGAVVFVIAIDRTALPESPFVAQLDVPGPCDGLSCASTVVDAAPSAEPTPSSEPSETPLPAPTS